jgi:AraC-like DNA-binding protein
MGDSKMSEIAAGAMSVQQPERAATRARSDIQELAERIAGVVPQDGRAEALDGVQFFRHSRPSEPIHGVSRSSFCIIAQGSKAVFLGDTLYRYDPAHYLLATAELPIVGQIIEATRERPYLAMSMALDLNLVASVMVEAGHVPPRVPTEMRAIEVSPLDAGLLDAMVRLARLLDSPDEARFLAPLVKREILFRLLTGEQGDRLRDIAVHGGHTQRMAEALQRIRTDYDQPLQIEEIAQELGMSVSSFYQHFKAVTALSPLQFQKRLRLQEARRLMMGENLDAASAAYRVGYDDASHFSREYRRLFGLPPIRDVQRLREEVLESVEA